MAFGIKKGKSVYIGILIQIALVVLPVYIYGWTIGTAIMCAGFGLQKYFIEKFTGGILVTTSEEAWE